MKRTSTLLSLLIFCSFFGSSVKADILPNYITENYIGLKSKVPTLVYKEYEAIDKFDKIETGASNGISLIIDYSAQGEMQKLVEYKDGKLKASYVFEYNKKGVCSSEKHYNEKGEISRYTTLEYNSAGKLSARSYFSAKGEALFRRSYIYDLNGRLQNEQTSNSKGVLIRSIKYEYDANANLIKEILYQGNNILSEQKVFTYNENNQKISEEVFHENGSIKMKQSFRYDAQGNEIERSTQQAGHADLHLSFQYTYDANGNWTKKISYQNKIFPIKISYRDFKY